MNNNRWLLLASLLMNSAGLLFAQPEGPGYGIQGRPGPGSFIGITPNTPVSIPVGGTLLLKAESTPTTGVLAAAGTDSVSPRFEAFWMFGDGNFIKSSNGTLAGDVASLNAEYRFAQAGDYAVAVALTKKYTDRKPPEYLSPLPVTVTEPAATGGSVYPFARKLTDSKLVHIFSNHPARSEYPLVCPVSFIKNPDFINQSVIILYNRKTSDTPGPTRGGPFNFTKALPNSFLAGSGSPVQFESNTESWGIAGYSNDFRNAVTNNYGKALVWNRGTLDPPSAAGLAARELRVMSSPHESIAEWRLFPEFLMDSVPEMISKNFQFVAILLGSNPNSKIDAQLLAQHLPGVNPANAILGAGTNTPLFIQDIAVYSTTVLSSHDPSFLSVNNLCKNGPNRYDVEFSLTLCNTGQLPETQAFITLEEPGTPFSEIHFDQFVPISPNISAHQLVDNRWKFTVTDNLDVVRLLDDGTFTAGCRSAKFTMTTDDVGAARLYENEPAALQPVVKFLSGGDHIEYSEFQPVPAGRFKKGNEIKSCDDSGCNCPIKICCDYAWICWLALLILLLLLILWWFFKKNQTV